MTRFGMLVLTLSAVLALLAQAPTAAPDPAQAAARQRTATELIGSLQSPFCPGLTLPACPSWHADTLRRALRRRILGGEDPGRLRREMAARYGQYVLGEPTWQGFDVIGWLGPGALLLLGGVTLALVLRRYAGRPRRIARGWNSGCRRNCARRSAPARGTSRRGVPRVARIQAGATGMYLPLTLPRARQAPRRSRHHERCSGDPRASGRTPPPGPRSEESCDRMP